MAIDAACDTWATIKKACNEGIDSARGVIEQHSVNERTADWARGELSAFRLILSLAEPRSVVQPSGDYKLRKDRSGI